jgi:transcriptional/translational regulatory protein YebC/TACO1
MLMVVSTGPAVTQAHATVSAATPALPAAAYGIGGSGFVIDCLTDNVNRSVSDVKAAITKAGGKVGSSGL